MDYAYNLPFMQDRKPIIFFSSRGGSLDGGCLANGMQMVKMTFD